MIRPVIAELPGSKIREVANAGLGRSDVLAFWFGESDEPTPAFVRDAAAESLARGETFYAHNLGLPELRAAIAAYASALHRPLAAGRVAVTSSLSPNQNASTSSQPMPALATSRILEAGSRAMASRMAGSRLMQGKRSGA